MKNLNYSSVKKQKGMVKILIIILILVILLFVFGGLYFGAKIGFEILLENKNLKKAITNLTHEDQIGYAKVISQEGNGEDMITTLKFIETARDDKNKQILTKTYKIAGDIIHFDALIVKFDNRVVTDGKEKSLYLWRRVYGEKMRPDEGFPIENEGEQPERYRDLLDERGLFGRSLFSEKEKNVFWEGVWDLGTDPEKMKKHGVIAVYGNVVYSKLKPGLIYIFKISNTGQLYPEVVPDM